MIRHGEKPHGDSHELSLPGKRRADCIASIFRKHPYHTPKRIIAQPARGKYRSKRPVQTVRPLSKAIGVSIEQSCEGDDIHCVRDKIKEGNGPILISWEHKRLSKIIKSFLDVDPPKYPKNRYDLVWVLDTEKREYKVMEQHCSKEHKMNLIAGKPPTSSALSQIFFCSVLVPLLI
jgi:hypothetical protein